MNEPFWEFEPKSNIVKVNSSREDISNNEKKFSFQIVVYKDEDTHEESLKVISLYDGQENGFIITTLFDLENDIKKLMRYGVAFSAIEFRDLYRIIKDNYFSLEKTSVSLDDNKDDERLGILLEQIKGYAEKCKGEKDKDDIIKDDCFHIPVGTFNGLVEDCGYHSYEIKALRAMLADKKYIRVNGGRYAILTRIKGKPERVMAFKLDKLELSGMSGNGGADEK